MKLNQGNPRWQVASLGRHDIQGPMRVANAEATAARAWGNVYQQAGNTTSKVLMDIHTKSATEEANALFAEAEGQLNDLENTLYTSEALKMDSAAMEGIGYDDSRTEVIDGKLVTENSGYAPVSEVGSNVWAQKSSDISRAFGSKASSPLARKKLNARLSQQISAKTQNVDRHVLNLAVKNQQTSVRASIKESMRVGDTEGAVSIAQEAFKRGIFDQAQMNKAILESKQQSDLLRFQQELSGTESEAQLVKLSEVVLFSDSYMTSAQKASAARDSISKARYLRQQRKEELGEWREHNEVEAIIAIHNGEKTPEQLFGEKYNYDRAGFTRMYNMVKTPVPLLSNAEIAHGYNIEIGDMHFNSGPAYTTEQLAQDLKSNMWKSVKAGTLSYEDYTKKVDEVDKQLQVPFKAQPYRQTKEAIVVDILSNVDADTMQEVLASGGSINKLLLKKMGGTDDMATIAVKAIKDLNQYVRSYGFQADPIGWWEKNAESYKTDEIQAKGLTTFGVTYGGDVIRLGNGKIDAQSTEDNIIRNYELGTYGTPGSPQAMKELNKRALILKGVDPQELQNDY